MVSLAVGLAGFQAIRRQRQRLRQLAQCAELIQTITVEIRYGCSPVEDILRSAAQNEAFCDLSFLRSMREETLSDFSEAWKRNIENDPAMALGREEKALLIRFGESLGTTDSETQLLLCERFYTRMSRHLENAEARRTEHARLVCGGSVILALILFLLIL